MMIDTLKGAALILTFLGVIAICATHTDFAHARQRPMPGENERGTSCKAHPW